MTRKTDNKLIQLHASNTPSVQQLFDQALLWCYGFHHEQAGRSFRQLIEIEPDCALAYWGLAYSSAPFYNRPWSWFNAQQKSEAAQTGFDALATAKELSSRAAVASAETTSTQLKLQAAENLQLQQQLIAQLCTLYQTEHAIDDESYLQWQQQYASDMLALVRRYPKHPDLVALTAEALMNCTPWQLWDVRSGKIKPGSKIQTVLELLEPLLASDSPCNHHPGLLHLHVHALEMSPQPERCQLSAERLRMLALASDTQAPSLPPHLPHMATHIDVLTGNYKGAIETNREAGRRDLQIPQLADEFYQISRLHNFHLMLFAAMMAGRLADSLEAQKGIDRILSQSDSSSPDEWLCLSIEGFDANRLHLDIRFGNWQTLLDAKVLTESSESIKADDTNNYSQRPYARAMQAYAIGVARANLKETDLASEALEHFAARVQQVPDWYIINNNPARDILKVAHGMLYGEYHYHLGDIDRGLQHLRDAVAACDALEYCEPWPWMHPPRHALGALLLEQQLIDEATDVYETDLGLNRKIPRSLQHPLNVWSLKGLAECYRGSGNSAALAKIQAALDKAHAYADITINSSCFCRRSC